MANAAGGGVRRLNQLNDIFLPAEISGFAIPDHGDLSFSEDEIRAALQSGALSLIMLGADTAQLALARADTSYRCLSGSINLNAMQPQAESVLELRRSLIGELAANSQAQLAVNSSGLAIRDQVKLPWDNVTAFAVPFLLTKSNLNFRLTLDAERLSDGERNALLKAWTELASFLNPKSPVNGPPSLEEVPQWMTLEVASPRSQPRFFREWTAEPWQLANVLAPPFTFGEGQFNVLLTDQQPDNSRTPPESLARVVPRQVTIRRESAPVPLVVEVDPQPLTGTAGLRYDATASGGVWAESLTLADATLFYDPVETARALRSSPNCPLPSGNATPLSPLMFPCFGASCRSKMVGPNCRSPISLSRSISTQSSCRSRRPRFPRSPLSMASSAN